MAGSTGVLLPPKGYLQTPARDREEARHPAHLRRGDHRLRPPRHAFAAELYGVQPDMITFAKGVTSGTVPMGGVIVRRAHLRRLHDGPRARHRALPRLHLFGASARVRRRARDARPLPGRGAVRAREGAGAQMGRRAMASRARPTCSTSARSASLAASTSPPSPTPSASAPTRRWRRAFHEHDLVLRITGETLALSPPLIVTEGQVGEIFEKVSSRHRGGEVIASGAAPSDGASGRAGMLRPRPRAPGRVGLEAGFDLDTTHRKIHHSGVAPLRKRTNWRRPVSRARLAGSPAWRPRPADRKPST